MATNTNLDRFYKFGIGLLAWVVLGWMLLKTCNVLMGIVLVFGLSGLFTYILLAPVNGLEALLKPALNTVFRLTKFPFREGLLASPLPRIIAILMVYLAFALTMLVASVRLLPLALDQLGQFSGQLPGYVQQAEEWILNQPVSQNFFHQEVEALKSQGEISVDQQQRLELESEVIPMREGKLTPTEKQLIKEKVFGHTYNLNEYVKNHISDTFQNFMHVISTTLTGFVYTLTGLVLVFYFLLDGKHLKEQFVKLLPLDMETHAEYLLSNMHLALYGFVKGQVMLGIATGIYMFILYTVFDVPYAIFLGSFFAISEVIPVVGTWIGFFPGILVLLFMNPLKLLMVMGLVYVFQVIKDNIVAPKVLAESVGLHPVIVIISLLVCAQVAGFVGVVFAIPLASMLNVIIQFIKQQEAKQFTV